MRYFVSMTHAMVELQVKDENDTVLYKAKRNKGPVVSLGHRYDVSLYNGAGELIYTIEKKGTNSKYRIMQGEKEVGSVKPAFSPLGQKVKIESENGSYQAKGKILKYKYTISRNGAVVATTSKKFVNLKNEYFFDTDTNENLEFLFAIATILGDMSYQHQLKMQQQNNE